MTKSFCFQGAAGAQITDGVDLIVKGTVWFDAKRGIIATPEVWNGRFVHAARHCLDDMDERAKYCEAAHSRHPAITSKQVEDAVMKVSAELAEQAERHMARRAAGADDDEALKEQRSLTPPGFVCVALDEDGDPVYLLRNDDGTLTVAESVVGSYQGETVTHLPPKGLTWVLPNATRVLDLYEEAKEDGWATALLGDLEGWYRNASDLGRDEAYLLLALYALVTYVQEMVDYLAIIVLEAEPERGKTRTGQAATYVCRHGLHLQGIREANLIRCASDRQATMFIDLMNVWEVARREKVEDVILGRWERGGTVERVLYPEKGAFEDTVTYNVFGPTIIATNEPIHRILETRCLRVDMPLSARKFSGKIKPEDATPLVERLMAWRAVMLGQGLVEAATPTSGRLGDILRPLRQVLLTVAPDRSDDFDNIITWQSSRRREEVVQGPEAAIVTAVEGFKTELETKGHLEVEKLLSAVNQGRPLDKCWQKKGLTAKLRSMGWDVRPVGDHRRAGLKRDDALLERLKVRYGLSEEKVQTTACPAGTDTVMQPALFDALSSAAEVLKEGDIMPF